MNTNYCKNIERMPDITIEMGELQFSIRPRDYI
jgi:hypothetical protein